MNFEELRTLVEQQIAKLIKENRRKEEPMINDIRKKLPKEDQMCIVYYTEDDGDVCIQRARFHNGIFRSCENVNGFPLLVQEWMAIPDLMNVHEDDEE